MQISLTGIPARDKAIAGANYLADAVKSTLGPFGGDMLMEKGNRITNDGYTVSSAVAPTLPDEFERRGALVFHQACAKTNDQVGDATTTATVLAQYILKELLRYLPQEGVLGSKKTPAELKTMLSKELDTVLSKLRENVKTIETKDELIKSALVSVEDEELAQIIGDMQWEIGPDGSILVDESPERFTTIERVRGIRIDNGFGTSAAINNLEKQTLEVNDVKIILTNYTFGMDFSKISDLLQQLVTNGNKHIALVARAFSPETLRMCAENSKNGIYLYPINAPYTDQNEIMRDIAAVTGATYIHDEDMRLEDATLEHVGTAKRIVASRYSGIITGDSEPTKRIEQLETALKGEQSDFYRKMIESRIAQLKNGFAILMVGGQTEVDRKRRRDKCDDAVNAVRLALKGGTIRGAGLALKEVSQELPDTAILRKPLESIYNLIVKSAPDDFEIEDWVRDPYLVIESALTNAVNVASLFANVTVLVTSKDKKEKYENEDTTA